MELNFFKLFLPIILFIMSPGALAQFRCQVIFSKSTHKDSAYIRKIVKKFLETELQEIIDNTKPIEIKNFRAVYTVLSKQASKNNLFLSSLFWHRIEADMIDSTKSITPIEIKESKAIQDLWFEKVGVAQNIQTAYALSKLIDQVYKIPVPSNTKKWILEMFKATDVHQLSQRIRLYIEKSDQFIDRLIKTATESGKWDNIPQGIIQIYITRDVLKDNQITTIPIEVKSFSFFSKYGNLEEASALLKSINLPAERESFYSKMLRDTYLPTEVINRDRILNALRLLWIMKAYQERWAGTPEMHIAYKSTANKFLKHVDILTIQQKLTFFKKVKEIEELRLSEYIETSERINKGLDELSQSIIQFRSDYRGLIDPALEAALKTIESKMTKIFVDDFSVHLQRNWDSYLLLISEFRSSRRDFFSNKNIQPKSIDELGFDWSVVSANQSYASNGKDYNSVRFTPEVLKFFKSRTAAGDLFLIALNKSYVSSVNASGLRMMKGVHPLYRDIKVISKTVTKIRIIGKLIGTEIHFFMVFDRDASYKTSEMHKTIEHYSNNN